MKKQLNKEAAVKESNKSENYLDKIPVRNGDFGWVENNGLVTVEQENKGTYDRLAQKLFKTPKVSHVDLDRFGSFVWLQIDGERTIGQIGVLVKEKFGKDAEPLYERLAKYFYTLNEVKFISYKKKDEE
jgi:Coenzyme PQQ synthesis protein D (PqqD).